MVLRHARKGPQPGSAFWGCPEFPRCHFTVDAGAGNAASPTRVGGDALPRQVHGRDSTPLPDTDALHRAAGGSASRTFARRRTRFESGRGDALRRALVLAAVVGTFVAAVVARVNPAFGLLCGGIVAGSILLRAWLPPATTQAWAIGAEGERRTADYLAPLVDEGFVILHDLRIPGSPANIDHVVIGPPGVFVIETKNVQGRLTIRDGEVWIGGRNVHAVEELRRGGAAVEEALGPLPAPQGLRPNQVVCAHRADLPWLRRSVGPVRIASGRGLVELLRRSPAALSPDDIHAIAARLFAGLGRP